MWWLLATGRRGGEPYLARRHSRPWAAAHRRRRPAFSHWQTISPLSQIDRSPLSWATAQPPRMIFLCRLTAWQPLSP